jgi:hypothetical protein
MNLPQINLPRYTLVLPSTGETIMFRPFTVKEEQLLLIAIDDEIEAQIRALRQVLENCLINSKLNVYKLPIFDIDYIWLKIRSKSVEEIVSLPFECHAALPEGITEKDDEGNERNYCGYVVNVPVNLDTIEIKKNPENNPKIELQDGIGIVLSYPTFEVYQKLTKLPTLNESQVSFEVIIECIEMIYDKDGKTYEKEHLDKQELVAFLESLSQKQYAKILKFFDTLPVVRHEVHFKCPKCKHEADIIVEGTKSFLA